MPIGTRSRYQGVPIIEAKDSKGVSHPTIGMRLLGPQDPLAIHFRHTVAGIQPLEYLAFKYFGASEIWWRVADANGAQFPLEWNTGDVVNIPATEEVGRVIRTRRF